MTSMAEKSLEFTKIKIKLKKSKGPQLLGNLLYLGYRSVANS